MDFFDDESTSADDDGQESDVDLALIDDVQLIRWVHDVCLPLYRVSTKQHTWCPAWWIHAPAVWRFEMCRRAWEEAVVDESGSALSNWTLYHLDPHMNFLLSPTGPFSECRFNERHGFKGLHDPHPGLPVFEPDSVDFGSSEVA